MFFNRPLLISEARSKHTDDSCEACEASRISTWEPDLPGPCTLYVFTLLENFVLREMSKSNYINEIREFRGRVYHILVRCVGFGAMKQHVQP